MTENAAKEDMEPFQNPDLVPLEQLKLKVKTEGVIQIVPALNEVWASDRYFLRYEAPNVYDEYGSEAVGAKDYWMEVVQYMIDDFKWLLSLPFYKFWSNIVFNNSILSALVSFLQEAPPFYALENFPNFPEMQELLEQLRRYVLLVFTNLVTNKKSAGEYMSQAFLGNLLYENYIFTVPNIFDLCQLYGRENAKIIERILKCLFTLEPRYNNDLQRTIPALVQALENVEIQFNSVAQYSSETVPLSQQDNSSKELLCLEDMILYVLDLSTTVSVFFKNYPPAVSIFRTEDFMNKIVAIYESTIPAMYKKLYKLAYNDEYIPKYTELKHRLDVTRVEFLNLFRTILLELILEIQVNRNVVTEAGVKQRVEEYLHFLTNAISEKEFITDYHQFYPVEYDLQMLLSMCPDVDTIKCNYIMQSINATIGKPGVPTINFSNNIAEAVAGPSGIQNHQNGINSTEKKTTIKKNSVEIVSLISEIKEILFDLDEGFIETCLEHYNYDTAAVINAVLEGTLPTKLKELKEQGPSNAKPMGLQPADYSEVNEDLACGIGGIDMYDYYYDDDDDDDQDEHEDLLRVKAREEIAVPKDYITKNYSLVAEDYEDEYDDSFTTPRVFLPKQKVEATNESDTEDGSTEVEQKKNDHSVQNQQQTKQDGKAPSNVVGKPKGQGQDKNTLYNRQQKKAHKASRANHNRRSGAQWKRRQGMVPS